MEDYSEAAANRVENTQYLEAALLKQRSVVHHHEREEFARTRVHHQAEQARFNLQKSLAAHEAEHQEKELAERGVDTCSESNASTKTVLSAKDYVKSLGMSKLKSNCPIFQEACRDHDAPT